ncbi:MAG: PIN domain-containing protein [Mahellales bacterium]|jgi:predicted nucleic acid-binding protein
MEYISSDTNVWIDFSVIGRIELPFLLPYTYIMNSDAIDDELLSPIGLRDELLRCGLVSVDITIEEFELAEEFGPRYPRLSIYDRIALAIAKSREIVLLTGDGALREAAKFENVNVIGTIGILDQLLDGGYINTNDYKLCLLELQKHNGKEVRLPKSEISLRLQRLNK